MKVDFHQHVWVDEFRQALERRSEPPSLRGRRLVLPLGGAFEVDVAAHTPEQRIKALDEAGLDAAVVSLPPTMEPTPDLAAIWNDGARKLAGDSGGRLIPIGYREGGPGLAGAIVAAEEVVERGAVHDVAARLEADGQLLFIHPGPCAASSHTWWAAGVPYTAQMQAAFATWISDASLSRSDLRVVFGLLGGGAPFQIERLVRRGLDADAPFTPNLWLETSSYGERALELSFQTFGPGRIVFGSDAPVDRVEDARKTLARFGAALETQVLAHNPGVVLGGDAGRQAA